MLCIAMSDCKFAVDGLVIGYSKGMLCRVNSDCEGCFLILVRRDDVSVEIIFMSMHIFF
jgi:hypothetical protein